MTTGKFFKRIIAGAALLASTLTGAGQASARDARGPALWKVADADTTIYLFGTIHTLPEGAQWRPPAVAEAIEQSDSLVLEVRVDNLQETAQVVGSLGISQGLPPLTERVPPDRRDTLRNMVAASGLPPAFVDQLESWAAAITLLAVSLAQAGFSSDQGVETQLTELYKEANKPIDALETAEQQLGFLDTLSEETQRSLLTSTVEDPKAMKSALEAMLAAWLSGDVKAIAAFEEATMESPELRKAIFLKRNQAWSQWIATRLTKPGTVFLAVGAGHLAGKDSLQDLLEARGIKSQRVN